MSSLIEIIVRPDGQTQLQTRGFTGGQCRLASQFLERALGTTTSETLTPEYHEAIIQAPARAECRSGQ